MEKVTGKYTIKQIFQDHWPEYVKSHPDVPMYAKETVEKMLSCRNPEKLGYVKMACPDHPECYTIIPHSCKLRFCNACGKVATDIWLNKACLDFPNVSYSHITLTIPSELRELFLSKPEQRKVLFQLSSKIVLDWCEERGFVPAVTAVLHTFGRDLKFHPHIHMLVSAGGLDRETKTQWRACNFLPEGMLKIRWRTMLTTYLFREKLIYWRLRKELFRMKWYVYVAQQLLIAIVTTNYVGRYTKRPPLAEARILGYDGQNITFFYEDWYYGKSKSEMTLNVFDFISRLIWHIPPKHFRMIKHYGLLNNRSRKKYLLKLQTLFGQIKVCVEKTTWRQRQGQWKKTDPLVCPKCQKEMIAVEMAFWSKSKDTLFIKTL